MPISLTVASAGLKEHCEKEHCEKTHCDENAQFLTPEQIAMILQVDLRTVYRMLKRGEIDGAKRLGKRLWRIPRVNYDHAWRKS